MWSHAFFSSGVRWLSIFIKLPTISSRIRRTRAEPFAVMHTITLRRSSRATERTTWPRFSKRSTRPLAAAVVCPIFCAIADIVSTSFRSRYVRRKNCGKETLPGASSLHKCSTKQRCISKTMWESRSASARIWSLGVRANPVTVSVFKAIKLETRAKPVKPAERLWSGRSRDCGTHSKVNGSPLTHPRSEHQPFHPRTPIGRPRAATTQLIDSNQKGRGIPGGLLEKIFHLRVCRECNAPDHSRLSDRQPTSPAPEADRDSPRPSFLKSPAAQIAKGSRRQRPDFPASRTQNNRQVCQTKTACPV